jgi:proteasome lid subunit RPN8/RPN11
MSWQATACAHAAEVAPAEACGLLLVINGRHRYWPCRNISQAPEQTFVIDPADYARGADAGAVVAIVHSHPEGDPLPSDDDRLNCNASGLPWWITTPGGHCLQITPPVAAPLPLEGRPWVWGINDCWDLAREWYQRHGLTLPDWQRPSRAEFNAAPWFDDLAAEAGFHEVQEPPAWGDLLFMRLSPGATMTDHVGVVVGDRLLHHLEGRLSSRDRMIPYLACGYRVMRHENSSTLRPIGSIPGAR